MMIFTAKSLEIRFYNRYIKCVCIYEEAISYIAKIVVDVGIRTTLREIYFVVLIVL